MDPMNGVSRPRTLSSSIEAGPGRVALTVAILVGIGALLASARIGSHLHLHLPGHQGLIRVAVMMIAARIAGVPFAATIMAAGAGAVAWYSPDHGVDPTGPLVYLLAAAVIDFSYRFAPQWRANAAFLGLVGAAANAMKPLSLWVIAAASGAQFESLEHGLSYPLLMHIAFGIGAGLTAWGLVLAAARKR
jgi:hypothetical protein